MHVRCFFFFNFVVGIGFKSKHTEGVRVLSYYPCRNTETYIIGVNVLFLPFVYVVFLLFILGNVDVRLLKNKDLKLNRECVFTF